ncbi:MAG: hypothetical protein WEB37_05610 [Bacteroidota bacterium]
MTSSAGIAGNAVLFGQHEWIRILIPGFFFTVLLSLFYESFLTRYLLVRLDLFLTLLLFAGFTLAAGLTMYARETPKRRKAFQENQPSQYLSAKARTMKGMNLLDAAEAQRLYFYILNIHIPPAFYEKIFLFGTVYHIMVQIRRTTFWFALTGTLAALYQISAGIGLADQQGLMVFTIGVWLLYVLNIRHNKADRKMQENYQDQILWLQMNNNLVEDVLRRHHSVQPFLP